MKIAYVCYEDKGQYASSVENEDLILFNFLKNKNLDVSFEIWTNSNVDWGQYDLAILKSPWDYFDKINEFYHWLEKLEQLGVRLLNPAHIVRWNSDKHYLQEIADGGLPVIPTLYFEKDSKPEIEKCFESLQSDTLIVKPCISGGSKNTIKISRTNYQESVAVIEKFLSDEAYMVQPFLKEVEGAGEWSFLFFNGKFSHCLLKKAKPGDFRVQHYLGGTIHAEQAPEHLLKSACDYVKSFAPGCLYARVDGLEINGSFILMELELIEPFLFMFTNPDSYQRYYEALLQLREKAPEIQAS